MTERSLNSNQSNIPMKEVVFKDNWTRLSRGLNNFKVIPNYRQTLEQQQALKNGERQNPNQFEELLDKINGITEQILSSQKSGKKSNSAQKEVTFSHDLQSSFLYNSNGQRPISSSQVQKKQLGKEKEMMFKNNKMSIVQELSQVTLSDASESEKETINEKKNLKSDQKKALSPMRNGSRPQTNHRVGRRKRLKEQTIVNRSESQVLYKQSTIDSQIRSSMPQPNEYSSVRDEVNSVYKNQVININGQFNTCASGSQSSNFFQNQRSSLPQTLEEQIKVIKNTDNKNNVVIRNRLMSANPRFRDKNLLLNKANSGLSTNNKFVNIQHYHRASQSRCSEQNNISQPLIIQNNQQFLTNESGIGYLGLAHMNNSDHDNTSFSVYPESIANIQIQNVGRKSHTNKFIRGPIATASLTNYNTNMTQYSGYGEANSSFKIGRKSQKNQIIMSNIRKNSKFLNKIDQKLYLDKKNKVNEEQDNKENNQSTNANTHHSRPQSSSTASKIKHNNTYRMKTIDLSRIQSNNSEHATQSDYHIKMQLYLQDIQKMKQNLQPFKEECTQEISQLCDFYEQISQSLNQAQQEQLEIDEQILKDLLLNCKVIVNLKK